MYYTITINFTTLPYVNNFTVRTNLTETNGNYHLVHKSANKVEKYAFRNRLIIYQFFAEAASLDI